MKISCKQKHNLRSYLSNSSPYEVRYSVLCAYVPMFYIIYSAFPPHVLPTFRNQTSPNKSAH